MLKKICASIFTMVLVFAFAVVVFAARPVYVTLDGILQNFEYEILLFEGKSFIDARETSLLGVNRNLSSITPLEINGRTMVSLRDVASTLGLEISWENELGIVRLSSDAPDYSVFKDIEINVSGMNFTFEQALNRINEQDTRLIEMAENKFLLERERRELNDTMRENSVRGNARHNYGMAQIQMLRAREQLNSQFNSLEINERLIREGNEMLLRNALAATRRTELDIIQLKQRVSIEERNLALAELMLSLGLESQIGIRDATIALERSRTDLESLLVSREDNRLVINGLLGFAAWQNVSVTAYNWNFNEPAHLEFHIIAQLASAPTLALRQLDLDLAIYWEHSYLNLLRRDEQEDDYFYRGRRQEPSSVIELRNAVNAAQRAYDDAKDGLERQIRSTHNSIIQLQEQISAAEADLNNARQNYSEMLLRYVTGLATLLDLDIAKMSILNHEITLKRYQVNYFMLIMSYERPYL